MDNPTTSAARETPAKLYRSEGKSVFVSFLELFFRRWILVCGIFIVITFWSYFSLSRAPETYQATGQVMIRRGSVDAVRGTPILRQQEEVGSEIDILMSQVVADESVSQLLFQSKGVSLTERDDLIFGVFESSRPVMGLSPADLPTDDPARLHKFLRDKIRTAKFGESNVIEVSLISANPRFAAVAVNTMIDVYEKYHLSVDQAQGQVDFFGRELDAVDSEINSLQDELAELMASRGIVDLKKQTELLALRRHSLLIQLDELQVDKVGVSSDIAKIDRSENILETAIARSDPSLQSLRQRLFAAEGSLAELKSQYQIDNPIVISKVEEVREIRANVEREGQLIAQRQRHLLTQILDKEKEFFRKVAKIDAEMRDLPMVQAAHDRLDRDIKQRILNRVDLVEQMFRATTMERSDVSLNKVRVLAYSPIPAFPREARKAFKMAVATILSLVASIVAALFIEGLDHTVSRREEIEERLQIPYLASIGTHRR